MNSSVKAREALATSLTVNDDSLSVELADGRTIAAPLAWYPRLLHATPEERNSWRLIGGGRGIRWPAVDEDISVANLARGPTLGGKPVFVQEVVGGPLAAERRSDVVCHERFI